MQASNLTITLPILISCIIAVGVGLANYFSMKSRLDLQDHRIKELEKETKLLHSRISDVNNDVKENKKSQDNSNKEFSDEIHDMEKRILEAIYNIPNSKKITKK